jgi:hypothetical protein
MKKANDAHNRISSSQRYRHTFVGLFSYYFVLFGFTLANIAWSEKYCEIILPVLGAHYGAHANAGGKLSQSGALCSPVQFP